MVEHALQILKNSMKLVNLSAFDAVWRRPLAAGSGAGGLVLVCENVADPAAKTIGKGAHSKTFI